MLRPATGRLAGIVIALTLLAAACGTDSATVDTATAAADTDSESATETNDGENSADTSSEASDESADVADGSDTSEEPAAEAQEPEPVGDHEFPDLGTVNIADGTAVNLADQLAGGDTPVLLWFFAPH